MLVSLDDGNHRNGAEVVQQARPHSAGMAVVGEPFMQVSLVVGVPVVVGTIEGFARRYIPILGGTVSGHYCGKVVAGGADWQTISSQGVLDIDAHYVLAMEQGQLEIESKGLRAGPPDVLERLALGQAVDPELYYFRTTIRFKTAAPQLLWLNEILGISVGERLDQTVNLKIYEVA